MALVRIWASFSTLLSARAEVPFKASDTGRFIYVAINDLYSYRMNLEPRFVEIKFDYRNVQYMFFFLLVMVFCISFYVIL